MACYFHMRAIFLRVASKETRGKQERVWEKTKLFLQERWGSQRAAHRSLLGACCLQSRFSPCHRLGQKPPQMGSQESRLQHIQTNQYPRSFFYFRCGRRPLKGKKKVHFWHICSVWLSFRMKRGGCSSVKSNYCKTISSMNTHKKKRHIAH